MIETNRMNDEFYSRTCFFTVGIPNTSESASFGTLNPK